jgi:folylpolyglutamate synthase/dihydropteroate synthase
VYADLVLRHQAAIQRVHDATPGGCTHFEVTTALALAHFAASNHAAASRTTHPHGTDTAHGSAVDVAVIEVGLGGVRDATNVFPSDVLEAAAVTTLDLEHLAALGGDSISHVADAKAGIFKCAFSLVRSVSPCEA